MKEEEEDLTLDYLLSPVHPSTPTYDLSKPFESNLLILTPPHIIPVPSALTLLASFSTDTDPRSRDLSLSLSESGHLTLTQSEIDSCLGMLLVKRCNFKVENDDDTDVEECKD